MIFALYCGISRIGNIRLGRDDEQPEFGMLSWFAMLFSAGMGIGLVFYGVAEPLSHYVTPPVAGQIAGSTDAAANQAMELTLFHWGLHAWAIYVVVGLGLAYMTYRKGRPLSIRWLLEPLLGRARIEGKIGHAIDVVAIVGTLFGVATSLGFGVQQISAGLDYLGWVETDNWLVITIIVIVTGMATFSVVSGVTKGLKWLSNINMMLAAALALFVLILGPTLFLMQSWVQNLGGYVQALPELMLRTSPFAEDGWQGAWTIFYWGWWMSWAPFVGMFIARISRGRTIREFVFGVLLAPTLVGSLWFTIFGNSGILRQRNEGTMLDASGAVDTNTSAVHASRRTSARNDFECSRDRRDRLLLRHVRGFRLDRHRHPCDRWQLGDLQDHACLLDVPLRCRGRSSPHRGWQWIAHGAANRCHRHGGTVLGHHGAGMSVDAEGVPIRGRFGTALPAGFYKYLGINRRSATHRKAAPRSEDLVDLRRAHSVTKRDHDGSLRRPHARRGPRSPRPCGQHRPGHRRRRLLRGIEGRRSTGRRGVRHTRVRRLGRRPRASCQYGLTGTFGMLH